MYSVFLVEDEIVTREGIRNNIPWDNTPYTLVGEAPDGELALSALRDLKPDILITDIKMPFMDGLELSKIIKRDQPWIKIIILSGHDEFEYAKQAISIGVEEYMLKPISSQDMLASLDKVSKQINEEKVMLTNMENLKLQIKSNEDVIKEKWLCDLITGQINVINAIETTKSIGIDLIGSGYVILIIEIFPGSDDYGQISVVKRIISSIIGNRKDILLFQQSLEKQILLVKNVSEESLDETLYPLAQGIKFETERNTDCTTAIAIGPIVNHIEEIIHSYADANKAIRYMSVTGKKNIIGAGDMKWSKAAEPYSMHSDHIVEHLRFASSEEIDGILAKYMNIIGDFRSISNGSGYFYIVYSDILDAVGELIEDLQGNVEELIPEECSKVENKDMSHSLFLTMTRSVIEAWIEFRDSNIHSKNRLKIREAKKYIKEHFRQADLSLNTVASVVNVSPNHFSTIFSQEAEQTFIEYLTLIRINKARQLLLKSNMKCSDIAFEVGYNDPHYFSYIFKKNTGASPRAFRSSEQAEC